MVLIDTKMYQKIKNEIWLNIEKILKNRKRRFTVIIRNHFSFENLDFLDEYE